MKKENIISTNFIMTNRDIIAKFGVNSAVGILDVKHIDIPPKTYYKINEEMLLKVLKNSVVHEVNN